jgi:3-hydroxyisobutyrate dehydrogenase
MNASNGSQAGMPLIALLGAGTMGAGIAERLLDRGFPVNVWNRTPGPAARLAEHGATAFTTAVGAVGDADVVLTMLPTPAAVEDVMIQQGTVHAIPPGAVWAQMGTIGIEGTERLKSEVASARPAVAFVDAPVTGSREPARTGGLLILASGPERTQAVLEPVFEALGRTVWLGEAGSGSRMKLVLNTWLAFEVEAVAEVSAAASRLGVPYKDLLGAVTGGPLASRTALTKLAKMQSGDYSADFSLEWALKDLDLADAATGEGLLPVARSIAERWRRLVEEGYGRLDISAARIGLGDSPLVSGTGEAA